MATTPIILTTSTTISLEENWFVAQKDLYVPAAAEVQVECQWDLASDTGFTTIVWTTGMRAPDSVALGATWVEIPIPHLRLSPETAYYLRVLVRDDALATSAAASYITLTTAAAKLTAATWRAAQ